MNDNNGLFLTKSISVKFQNMSIQKSKIKKPSNTRVKIRGGYN